MAQRMTRKQLLKQDEITETAFDISQWIQKNLKNLIIGAVSIVVLAAIVSAGIWMVKSHREETARILGQGQREFTLAEDSGFQDLGELRTALTRFDEVIDRSANSASGHLARYYRASTLNRLGEADAAIETLEQLNTVDDLKPTVRGSMESLLADFYINADRSDDAVQLLTSALDQPGTGMPADQVMLKIAGIEFERGNVAEARSMWQRIITEHSESPAATDARDKLGR
jgi:tetratricopeptide (TPR) repeat protein